LIRNKSIRCGYAADGGVEGLEELVGDAGGDFDAFNEPDAGSPLMTMSPEERLIADFNGTEMTVGPHSTAYLRQHKGSGRSLHNS
jgi:hypothetical protein